MLSYAAIGLFLYYLRVALCFQIASLNPLLLQSTSVSVSGVPKSTNRIRLISASVFGQSRVFTRLFTYKRLWIRSWYQYVVFGVDLIDELEKNSAVHIKRFITQLHILLNQRKLHIIPHFLNMKWLFIFINKSIVKLELYNKLVQMQFVPIIYNLEWPTLWTICSDLTYTIL